MKPQIDIAAPSQKKRRCTNTNNQRDHFTQDPNGDNGGRHDRCHCQDDELAAKTYTVIGTTVFYLPSFLHILDIDSLPSFLKTRR